MWERVGRWSVMGFCGGQQGELGKEEAKEDAHLDDFEELLGAVDGADREAVKKLHWITLALARLVPLRQTKKRTHESSETLKGPRDTNARVHLDQDAPRSVDVHLQLPTLVQRRIQQRKQALHLFISSSPPPRLIQKKEGDPPDA